MTKQAAPLLRLAEKAGTGRGWILAGFSAGLALPPEYKLNKNMCRVDVIY